ncbi:MAG: peptidoglycan DD-metalloendopeptidase family protein [Actinomycetota bacterium]
MTTTLPGPWLRVVAVAAALLFILLASPLGAQDADDPVLTDADWVPFTGSYAVGCTRASAENPGCPVHHPTWAIDFATPYDTKIRATGSGTVVGVFRGCDPAGGGGECNGGAGNIVVVSHGDYWSRYLHLSEIPKRINVGRQVHAGDVIGRAGASGTFGATHLHYDEYQPGPPAGRVAFGAMFACHGDEAVVYPEVLGYDQWDLVPPGTVIRNDNHDCTGHPPQPHPPPPEPPVYPDAPALRTGGSPGLAVAHGEDGAHVVIGAPGARPDRLRTGGVVVVDPLRRSDQRAYAQGSSLLGAAESGDRAGAAVATGDFDCDGEDDLAIGVPGEDLDDLFVDTGAVNVVYADGDQQLLYAGSVIPSYYRRPHDWFGAALAVGDFGGDGCDDLAIASPGADRVGGLDMGLVWVLRGSDDGLERPLRVLQGVNLGGLLESGDQTGYSLAAGDFDCDGRDDLAAGVPRETLEEGRTGAVMVAYGTRTNFRRAHALYRGQVLPGTPAEDELLGAALAAGDIDGDGCDDLAIGSPQTTVEGKRNAGSALVVFGHDGGLDESELVREVTWGSLPGGPRTGDRAGSAVAIGDLDCDGHGDVIVGVPGRDISERTNVGAVIVAPGGPSGVEGADRVVRQRKGLKGRLHLKARVGESVVADDIDGDGCDDLLVSAPGTEVDGQPRAGAVHLAWGAGGTVEGRPPLRFDQRTVDIGAPSVRAAFGSSSSIDLLKRQLRR